jgi:hypothetical protein
VTVRGHQLAVDWSQQGTYANALEDVSSYVLTGSIEIGWGRKTDGDVTLTTTSGTLTFDLDNGNQLFSPENGSSPITGKVLPGREVRYQVTQPASGGTTYTLLAGVLDTFDIVGDPVTEFSASVLDGWGRPGSKTLSTPLYSGLRTGDAINLILDAIGWTGARDIDPGATVMPWWWEEGTEAASAVDKLVNSEGPPAIAYVEGGTFVFRDRHHRLFDARSTTSQGLFTHIVPAGSGPAGDFKIEAGTFQYDHGIKTIVNTATFSVDVRTPQAIAEVWSSDDTITIASGTTAQVIVQPSDPFTNAITPSEAGGEILVQSGVVSAVSLSRTSGQATILSITCSADTVITRLAVHATPVAVSRTVQVTASDTSSVGIFGAQQWPGEPVWANPYDAQAIANKVVATYATYRPTITFTIVGLDSTYLTKMMSLKISDRITVRNDKRGINADFMIERLAHRIQNLGILHRIDVTCQATEPVQPANVFTFDVAGKGFNDGFFAVDGIDSASAVFRFDVGGVGFDQGVFGT